MTRTVKERPILFSAPMVRALLDGTKAQTRRVVKPVRGYEHNNVCRPDMAAEPWDVWWHGKYETVGVMQACPYGQPGDRLWVRETHRPIFGQTCGLICVDYQADPRERWERLGDAPDCLIKLKWRPSIHMRREYSRILLEIVSVHVERLQDISGADAKAEGVTPRPVRQITVFGASAAERADIHRRAAVDPYRELWQQINGAGSWDANPWVWVVEFKRAVEIS
jgi:hypothetical protein